MQEKMKHATIKFLWLFIPFSNHCDIYRVHSCWKDVFWLKCFPTYDSKLDLLPFAPGKIDFKTTQCIFHFYFWHLHSYLTEMRAKHQDIQLENLLDTNSVFFISFGMEKIFSKFFYKHCNFCSSFKQYLLVFISLQLWVEVFWSAI